METEPRMPNRVIERLRAARQRAIETSAPEPPVTVVPEPDEVPFGTVVLEGERVDLRTHVPANRAAFQRWYADAEIAWLLRHDLQPLTERQSRGYFDTIILPMSASGICFAIHEHGTDRLVGTTALSDFMGNDYRTSMFRIVIGEKDCWDRGYGTEATRLLLEVAFGQLGLDEVKLEVFQHNPRAIHAYERVGFHQTGEHVEWIGPEKRELRVNEMSIDREAFRQQLEGSRSPGAGE